MLREKKTRIIDRLADNLSRSAIVIATNYQGLTAKQMGELRSVLVKAGVEYHVVRNTLARLAADKAGKPRVMEIIEGPTALAFGYGDMVNLAKVLNQYVKSTELPLRIGGGMLGERILTSDEVIGLASLPPMEVLISELITHLQAPLRSLHNVLNFPLQGLLTVLHHRAEKLGENQRR